MRERGDGGEVREEGTAMGRVNVQTGFRRVADAAPHFGAGVHRLLVVFGAAVFGVVLLVTSLGSGSGAPGDESQTIGRLRQIERTRLQALVDANTDVAASFLADDFELVPPPGFTLGRDDYLAAVSSGDLDYHVFEPVSDIAVRLHGTSAVLWYRSRIDITAAGQGRFAHEAWHMYLYEKRDGQWQVVREQATAVGGFPPPAG